MCVCFVSRDVRCPNVFLLLRTASRGLIRFGRIMLPLADGFAVRHGQQQLLLARGIGQHERALRAHPEAVEAPLQPQRGQGAWVGLLDQRD